MSENEFRAELRYRMSLSVAKSMLKEGIILEKEYGEIIDFLLEKHHPIMAALLEGKSLI